MTSALAVFRLVTSSNLVGCMVAKIQGMRFGAPWSLPEFSSSTPTTAAVRVCACGALGYNENDAATAVAPLSLTRNV
jgi:hypothetical protein